MNALVSALLLAMVVGLTRIPWARAVEETLARAESRLAHVGPVFAALATAAVLWFAWGAWQPIPRVQDESSYVLQARIFAGGRWTAPSPPAPDFFAQPHVLVEPALASKYPPGHALLLTPGAFIGFDALIPLLLAGATGMLLFVLARRVSNVWVASLAWLAWLTAPMVLRFEASFFSEVTTSALVLASWWLLREWRETRRSRWLLLLALAIGWGAITRPLTMLAVAIPIGIIVVRDTRRLRLWRALAEAIAIGIAVLAILPLWNARTTGDWRVSPLELYRRDYLPFDKMGFSADSTPPRRALSPQMRSVYDAFFAERQRERPAELPRVAADRVVKLVVDFFRGPRLPLLLFALIGLVVSRGALRFAALSGVVVLVAYLGYAIGASWTLYYLELTPVVATVAAAGCWWVATRVTHSAANRMAMLGTTVVVLVFGAGSVATSRVGHRTLTTFNRDFARHLESLPMQPAIVFVYYSPRLEQHVDVVLNTPHTLHDRVWVVHDLGARDVELLRLAPERAWYRFDEERLELSEPHAPGSPPPD